MDVDWFPDGYEVQPTERDRWLGIRRHGIGASEVAVLLGYSLYGKTPVSVWAEKVGVPVPAVDNDDAREGKLLEPHVADLYHGRTGKPIVKREVFYRYRDFHEVPLFATIDGIDSDGRIVEIKTVNQFQERERLRDGLPEAWKVQVQVQMLCSGIDEATVVAYLRGSKQDILFDLKKDPVLHDAIVEASGRFWEHVKAGVHPPVESASDLALIPHGEGESVVLDGHYLEYADRLKSLQKQCTELEKEKDAIRTKLAVALNGATYGRLPDGRVVESKVVTINNKAREASQTNSVRITIREPKI